MHKNMVKPMHKRTTRKKRTQASEMNQLADVQIALGSLIDDYHIHTPRQLKRRGITSALANEIRPVRDEFLLTGVSFKMLTLDVEDIPLDKFPYLADAIIFDEFLLQVMTKGLVFASENNKQQFLNLY